MPIQLIITGDHITDVFAEISNFASAIGEKPARTGQVVNTNPATRNPQPVEEPKAEAPVKADNKLNREQQDSAVEEMVVAGVKDERFDLLTKGRQKTVEDALAKKDEPVVEAQEVDVSDMFDEGDALPEAEPEVTADTIRELMAKVGKDENGDPIQDNLVKIQAVLTKFVPKGQAIKVGNIPQDKFASVASELKKLEA